MGQCEDLEELLRALEEPASRAPEPSAAGDLRSNLGNGSNWQSIEEFLATISSENTHSPLPRRAPPPPRRFERLDELDEVLLEPLEFYRPPPPEPPLVRAVRLLNMEEIWFCVQDAQPDELMRAADMAVGGLQLEDLMSELEPNKRTVTWPLPSCIALGLLLGAGATLSAENERILRGMRNTLRLNEGRPLREQLCANLKEKL